jgi:hypothetical protein
MDNALRGVSQNNANNRINNILIDKRQQYNEMETFGNMMSSAFSLNLGGVVKSAMQGVKNLDLSEGQRTLMNMNNEFANKNTMINAEQQIGLT